MARYSLSVFVFVCVCVLISIGAFQSTFIGEAYADSGLSPRGDRTDCNGNGIADEDEMHPLPGHALVFDGDCDYVDPGASAALADLTQGNFTIEAWIRTDDPEYSVLVSNAKNSAALYNFVILSEADGGKLRLRVDDGTASHTCTGSVTVTDGAWHHVAAAHWMTGGGCIRLYVDGQECGVYWGDYVMTPFTADNPTLIGRDQYASPHCFTGAMDEVRVWNAGRFQDDIQADMYRVLNGDEEGLVAYWRFDEGEGAVAYDSAGDSDGTLGGSLAWAPFGYDCNNNRVLDECDMVVDGVLYVDDDATGFLNDGLSWANPLEDLQDALAFAEHESRVTEIRVAGGTHKPGTDPDDSFHLQEGLALRGGYRGLAGGGDPDDRDIDAFESILSGDIGEVGEPSDNSKRVLVSGDVNASAVIEGFTMTEGHAGSAYGGGMFIAEYAGPTIARCKFVNNSAHHGGGMYVAECSSPTIDRCKFINNSAPDLLSQGGGLHYEWAIPTLTGCTFSGNWARSYGGAMYGYVWDRRHVLVENCTFSGNSTNTLGGGIYQMTGNVTLVNCTFSGNSSLDGGGVYFREVLGTTTLANCTFSGNSARRTGGAIHGSSSRIHAANCVLWGNTADEYPQMHPGPDVTFSCVQGGYDGTGNIDADPLFVDADGPDDVFGTEDDDLHLQEGSPCINVGDDEAIPSGVTTDLDGEPRIQQCRVDMGIYETPYFVGDDCNGNDVSDECDIEDCDGSPWCGDCNTNGVPDECDIAGGTSLDIDPADGIPDECNYLMMGACCLYGDCSVEWETDCLDAGGAYQGDGTTCDSVECPEELLGDMNGDGVLDANDIPLFTEALLNQGPEAPRGDMNEDGVLDGADIQPFINVLLGL